MGFDSKIIEQVLLKYKFDLSTRAENISTDVFVEIVNELLK